MYQEGDNKMCWCCLTDYTDYLAPTDAGAGKKIKFWFRIYLYNGVWDSLGRLSYSHNQIFITHLITKA